jgi:DNA polymerase elongation subunit (family B)
VVYRCCGAWRDGGAVKIVFIDIETSPMILFSWGLYDQRISPNNIIKDREIICICWKTLGEKRTSGIVAGETTTERDILAAFREAVEDADILVGHHIDGFDIKHINAKLIEHDMEPLNKINTLDTLKEVRKVAKFSSNRLDWLARKLLGGGKVDTGGMELWKQCMNGDTKALAKMLRYCKHDVVLLEQLYLRLLPYMKAHPNVADSGSLNCPKCNSGDVRLNKTYSTRSGIVRNHMRCNTCRSPFTMRAGSKSPRPLSML